MAEFRRIAHGDLFDETALSSEVAFSKDRRYRYLLRRGWSVGPSAWLYVMLNPSTADDVLDDPTVRRCRSFARREEQAGFTIVNLYGLVATDPAALARHPEPIGPENDAFLEAEIARAATVVCAWGDTPDPLDRAAAVLALILRQHDRCYCLGRTRSGQPRHPSPLANDARLEVFATRDRHLPPEGA